MKPPWIEKIKTEDLPENFRLVTLEIEGDVRDLLSVEQKGLAAHIALTAILKVMEHFEGDEPYFPQFDGTKFLLTRYNAIRSDWAKEKSQNGRVDVRRLAQKYDITVRRLRSIVNDHEDQQDLFPTQ